MWIMSNVNPLMPASNNTIQPVSSVASVKEVSNFTVENAIPQPKNEKDNSIQMQGSKPNLLKSGKNKEDIEQDKAIKRETSLVNRPSLSLNALINIQENLSSSDIPNLSGEQATKKYAIYQNTEEI